MSEQFVGLLVDAGVRAELLHTPELDHAGVNAAVGDPDDALITPALMAFLAACR